MKAPTCSAKKLNAQETFKLRQFSANDRMQVQSIVQACFPEVFTGTMIHLDTVAFSSPSMFSVADVNGAIAGFSACRLELGKMVELPRMGLPQIYENVLESEVIALAVLPEFRGRGIGSSLLEQSLKDLTARHVQVCRLEVYSTNLKAIRLYTKRGFKKVKTIPDYYPNGQSADVMVKSLNPRLEVQGAFESETGEYGDVVVRSKTGKGGIGWK